jgi:hypothetical protein
VYVVNRPITLLRRNAMYVYIESEKGLWTVGFYSPDGKWHPESDHETSKGAGERVHYLNGACLEI